MSFLQANKSYEQFLSTLKSDGW